ncbi:SDR family oxidoreductase [Pseudomonas sp. GD03860]|uniref:SDR family oxidoreductase n=1 Tax=Pseudomonas sp. GD03860 TaxID=2975389 RepID=UPI0024478620|nr:SDR family oxidoreductase [Pseudomonas sp. GD03860]MDH0638035.1 SDR family oxidoreductase [Pseudomonas sp. GD03860]
MGETLTAFCTECACLRCSQVGREITELNAQIVSRIPSGDWAEPEDMAGAAIFLASPAARYINGVTLPVDGGYVAARATRSKGEIQA